MTQEEGIHQSLSKDSTLATNETAISGNANATTIQNDVPNDSVKQYSVSIVPGAGDPKNNLFYKPADARVEKGTTITWTNDDQIVPHTVTAGNPKTGPSGDFDSGIMASDGKFSHTFDKEGVYDYYCTIHPWMEGKVTIE
jgi:plastocyanin